jgi:zinc carboxypeptidase
MVRRPLEILALLCAFAASLVALIGGGPGAAVAADPALPAFTRVLDEPLPGAPGTTAIACQDSWRPGTAGVATRTVEVPPGLSSLEVSLGGAAGDWDVAVFDAAGRMLAASAELGSRETGRGYTLSGGTLRVQACRRSGDAASVPVSLAYAPITGDAAQAKADAPQLVSVHTPTSADKDELLALGLDMTEHGGTDSLGVVLHGAADRAALRKAGFTWDVVVDDLVAQDVRARQAEMRAAARGADARALPSGRTGTYRRLADYNEEMKALAEANPGLVRTFVMPNKTWLGKKVMGIEIAEDVDRQDGRPAFFNMGVHHAREWPAGEMPMEWAYELVKGYKSGNARATNIVKNSRNIIVPIVNPDGFEASREAGEVAGQAGGRDESIDDTVYLVSGAATGGEYRRKNCRLPDDSEGGNCFTSLGLAETGVDPNRNYGQFWGGPGADGNPTSQSYYGPGPFSEPETRNIRSVIASNQVMSLITNHTTAALVLRAPGLAVLGDPVDENKGYKALGDAMAKENGYFSQKGFELYDTTGTTEDWSYNATGGFGFTFEIYCGDPNYDTGDCDDPAFHPTYATGVEKEWDGSNPVADHAQDPGPNAGYDGKGNREAYYLAAESAINSERHSIIKGKAPAGATLRLTKQFKTETSPRPDPNGGEDKPLTVDDKLESTLKVGSDGKYVWHVNPSTRPLVAKERGKRNPGEPSPPETTSGGLQGSSETADDPDDGAAVADATNMTDPPSTNYNDHPFTIPAGGDNASLSISVDWSTPGSDWDVKLYEDTDGNAKSSPTIDKEVGTSAQGTTNFEEVSIAGDAALTPGKKYVLRVINFAATEPYTVTKTYMAPEPFQAAKTEAWTLTCEVGGDVRQTEQVIIDRGQLKTVDLSACASGGAGGGGGGGAGACKAANGFESVAVRPSGKGAELAFARRAKLTGPVRIDVFKPATPRKVLRTRKVQRFDDLAKSVDWNGRDKKGRALADGYYWVRFLGKTKRGVDVRRVALQRTGGRFTVLEPFDRRDTCGILRRLRLSGPVFGGITDKPLRISYQLGVKADVKVVIKRGGTVVSRYSRTNRKPGQRQNLTLPSRKVKAGEYTVRLTAEAGGKTVGTTLVSRRI